MTVSTAILHTDVIDVFKQDCHKHQLHHEPTFFCSLLRKSKQTWLGVPQGTPVHSKKALLLWWKINKMNHTDGNIYTFSSFSGQLASLGWFPFNSRILIWPIPFHGSMAAPLYAFCFYCWNCISFCVFFFFFFLSLTGLNSVLRENHSFILSEGLSCR